MIVVKQAELWKVRPRIYQFFQSRKKLLKKGIRMINVQFQSVLAVFVDKDKLFYVAAAVPMEKIK